MWRATAGLKAPSIPPKPSLTTEDDWETDPDFVNDVSEKESRWGSKTVAGSGHQASVSLDQLRNEALKGDAVFKEKQLAALPKASEGYGGKFGVQADRMDKSAETFAYSGKVEAHASQKDYSRGFGGKFGVEMDRKDKSAAGWEERVELAKHDSQKDAAVGYGGKFGVQKDRKDKSAAGWDEKVELAKHESQKDAATGYGGKFGVQTDRKDKSAVGWDERVELAKHESQKDAVTGYGGKFGVQTDRKDKSAAGWEEHEQLAKHQSQKDASVGYGGKFGVESDRKDKSAAGWEERADLQQHESQKDYKKGFGGQFGVLDDRQDKSAVGYDSHEALAKHESQIHSKALPANAGAVPPPEPMTFVRQDVPVVAEKGRASNLKARFEQLAVGSGSDPVAEARERRKREDEELREAQKKAEEERQRRIDEEWRQKEVTEAQRDPDEVAAEIRAHEEAYKGGERRSLGRPAGAVAIMPGIASNNQPLTPKAITPVHTDEETYKPPESVPVASPPVAVLPGAGSNLLKSALKRAPSSDDEVDNDKDWEDDSSVKVLKAPTAPTSLPQYDMVPGDVPEIQRQPAAPTAAPSQLADRYEMPPAEDIGGDPLRGPSHPMGNTGLTAVAIFDYQKQDDDEISFEPDDVITNIEQVDAGWWRGHCNGQYGLFPANYVELR